MTADTQAHAHTLVSTHGRENPAGAYTAGFCMRGGEGRGGEGRVSGFVAFIIRHSVRRLNLGQCGKKATRTSWASWQRGEEGREREGERERSATKREKEGSESEVCVCVCTRIIMHARARVCMHESCTHPLPNRAARRFLSLFPFSSSLSSFVRVTLHLLPFSFLLFL